MAAIVVEDILRKAEEAENEIIQSIQVEKHLDVEYDLGNLSSYDPNEIDLNELSLPTGRVENEIVVKLPDPVVRLPRAKPVPIAKPLTKWEQFAREKGIVKKKKPHLVWDEELKKWVPRFGYQKRLAEKEKNWVVEMSGTAKDSDDPVAQKKKKKEEGKAKNELLRLRNISKRTATSKSKSKISLEPCEKPTVDQLNRAVFVAHTATASIGKFQPNLPDQKSVLKSGQKRKFEPLVGDIKSETKKSLELLDKMKAKKPQLDVEKAVNREMGQTPSQSKSNSLQSKSKSQLKREVGKRKHKGKNVPMKKGKKSKR
nr:EOG090X0CBY [Cyclestheria hislopi]